MEKYKKKSLNFMGFSRELRKNQRDNQRCLSRHQRFSIIRPLDEESISEEKKEDSKIPTIGKPNTQVNSRVELLQKWKQEKMVKKQQESKLKKPAFKVGVNKPNPSPSIGNKPLFALDTSSRLFKSSFQVSNSVLFSKKQESLNASKTKTNANKLPAKKTEVDAVNTKTISKDMKIQPSKLAPIKPEPKWTKNKESGIQSFSTRSKVDTTSKVVNKDEVSGIRKQPTMISKPLETKKESQFQPLSTRSKISSFARDGKNTIPSSGLPKPTISRTFSKVPSQQIPVKKNAVKSIPKISKIVVPQQRGNDISEKTKKLESNVPKKPNNDFNLNSFECELSHIEPAKETKKSFAPEGFMFQPPAELSTSLFLEDGPSAIFMRLKSQFLRTSTPKQSSSNKQFSPKIEDNECLKNKDIESLKNSPVQFSKKEDTQRLEKEDTECSKKEDTQCLEREDIECSKKEDTQSSKNEAISCSINEGAQSSKDENSQHSKNTNEEFVPLNKKDFETVLSSSLESVSLNDMKLINCKQSLKFEFSEGGPVHNQEEMLLPSKTLHAKCSMATESPLIKLPALSDLVVIDNFTDAASADEWKISEIFSKVDSVDCEDKDISDSAHIEQEEIAQKIQGITNGFLRKQEIGLLKIPEITTEKFRQSRKPTLASINESVENTPKSALKKKFLDNVFTPRRSLRLAKLSGNFNSLENLLVSPKPKEDKDKAGFKENSTPRRSLRLSKFSTEFNSAENLFDIRRPTLYGTPPEEDGICPKLSSRVTYDFDRLSSETEEEICPRTTRSGKVSLLYTPPNKSRASIMRQSLKGDLMSFSPNI